VRPYPSSQLEAWQLREIRLEMLNVPAGSRSEKVRALAARFRRTERSIYRIVAGTQGTRSRDSWAV
jgi:hypothetical protein